MSTSRQQPAATSALIGAVALGAAVALYALNKRKSAAASKRSEDGSGNSPGSLPQPSRRSVIPSFKVMDVVAAAAKLEASGTKVFHLEVGQPMTGAPPKVCALALQAVSQQQLGYTPAKVLYAREKGLTPLRDAILKHYAHKEGVTLGSADVERVIVTTGSSGGFLLVFHACFDAGDTVAVGTTCYPCYRNILQAMNVSTCSIPLNAEFKITALELGREVARRRRGGLPRLKGLIQSSPANPTGAMLTPEEVRELCQLCEQEGIWYISDELYHGITFGAAEASALRWAGQRTIVVNSFSKYYSMTGWRLGWLVLPPCLVDSVNRLQQNMFINAPTLSQVAAVACFDPDTDEELKKHVQRYKRNKSIIASALLELGITDVSPADGAFYMYVDLGGDDQSDLDACSKRGQAKGRASAPLRVLPRLGLGAEALCSSLLAAEGVALTPGTDFEDPLIGRGPRRVRLSFPGRESDVAEAMAKLKAWWPAWTERVRKAAADAADSQSL